MWWVMTTRIFGCALVALALLTARDVAHHNMSGAFDLNDRLILSGTLKRLDWRNPHIGLEMDVAAGSAPSDLWNAEGPAPSFFRSHDIDRDDLQQAIGKAITVEISRARDGSHSGLLRSLTLPDGNTVAMCPLNC
jgi:hypothetical protein